MNSAPETCPKCNGRMEQGFTLDMGHGKRFVSQWGRGAPLKSFFFETQTPSDSLPIGTYRCAACGYLESYAQKEFASTGRPQFSLQRLFIVITAIAMLLGVFALIQYLRR